MSRLISLISYFVAASGSQIYHIPNESVYISFPNLIITLAFVTLESTETTQPITKIRNLEVTLYPFLITNQS